MKYASKLFVTITALLLLGAKHSMAQEQERKDSIKIEFNEDAPMLSARETPKRYYIRKVNVSGIKNLNENLVRATSGLIPGDSIYLPSSFVGNSITRLWGQRYFSDVKVGATIDGDSVDLELMLKERPRVYNWNIVGEGIGSSKRNDLLEKLALRRNSELSDYVIDRSERLLKKEYTEKGYRNVEVNTRIENDTAIDNAVNVTFEVKRNPKVRVQEITFSGNEGFEAKRLRRTFKKTHQKSILFFQNRKLKMEDYKEDKNLLIDFYNSNGYRNATILSDSIYTIDDENIGIHINLSEGNKFYIRDVKWVGNSAYPTEQLQQLFGVKKGDMYDKKSMHKRLGVGREVDPEGVSVASMYQNNGYLMSQIEPAEHVVAEDTIDMEIKVFEGKQFTINNVGITGNTRVNDEAIRRELTIYPGMLYDRSMLMY